MESVSHMQLLVSFCVFSFLLTSITVNWNFVFSDTFNKLKVTYLRLYKLSVIVKLKGKSYFSRSSISI